MCILSQLALCTNLGKSGGAKLPLKKKLKLSEIAAGADGGGEEEEENEAGAGSEVDDEDYDVDDGEDDCTSCSSLLSFALICLGLGLW
jgi:hypothetical protein